MRANRSLATGGRRPSARWLPGREIGVTGSSPRAGSPSDDKRSVARVYAPEVTPLERLARRIWHAANARGDVGAVIAIFKQRASISVVKAALDLAIANQWLRFDGIAYALTPA